MKKAQAERNMNRMAIVNPSGSALTLNMNALSPSIKRHRIEWMKKQDPIICYLPKSHFKDTQSWNRKDGKKYFIQVLTKREQDSLYLYQTKGLVKNCYRTQRKIFYNDKGEIHQENKTLISIYAPNIRTPKYIRQTLT